MATGARSEAPDTGDQSRTEVSANDQQDAQGPESFQGLQTAYEDKTGPNQLDDIGAAGGDAKAKAQAALSSDGPYGKSVEEEGNNRGTSGT